MTPSKVECACGFLCGSREELRTHREGCALFRRGFCRVCGCGKYRHRSWCSNSGEDLVRRKLLEKHEIDLEKFDVFLRVMSKHYRKLARSRLI